MLDYSVTFNKTHLPHLNQAQLLYAYIELRPRQVEVTSQLPLNICLALDKSGSMSGEKLKQLKRALESLIRQLQPNDMISIVGFDSKTKILAEAMNGNEQSNLINKVNTLKAGGGT